MRVDDVRSEEVGLRLTCPVREPPTTTLGLVVLKRKVKISCGAWVVYGVGHT